MIRGLQACGLVQEGRGSPSTAAPTTCRSISRPTTACRSASTAHRWTSRSSCSASRRCGSRRRIGRLRRAGSGAALRRGARRCLAAGHARHAQPHAAHLARRARGGVPGRAERVTLTLDGIGHRFGEGRRLRIGFSPTYWPLRLAVTARGDPAHLRRRTRAAAALPHRRGGGAVRADRLRAEDGGRAARAGVGSRRIERDLATGSAALTFDWDMGGRKRAGGKPHRDGDTSTARYSIVEGDPLSARVVVENTSAIGRATGR